MKSWRVYLMILLVLIGACGIVHLVASYRRGNAAVARIMAGPGVCPYCRESIDVHATICPHCQSKLK